MPSQSGPLTHALRWPRDRLPHRLRHHDRRGTRRDGLRDPRRPARARPHRRLRVGARVGDRPRPARARRGVRHGHELFGLPYKIRNRVVEFEEGRLIAWRHFGGHRWRYELTPIPGGTRVTESFDYSPYNRVGAAVIRFAGFPERNRRGIEETLARLKAAAEQDADHESGD